MSGIIISVISLLVSVVAMIIGYLVKKSDRTRELQIESLKDAESRIMGRVDEIVRSSEKIIRKERAVLEDNIKRIERDIDRLQNSLADIEDDVHENKLSLETKPLKCDKQFVKVSELATIKNDLFISLGEALTTLQNLQTIVEQTKGVVVDMKQELLEVLRWQSREKDTHR